MRHRFRFLGNRKDSIWHLEPGEVAHFLKVLRLKNGDIIEVGDGQGSWACGPAKVVSKTKVHLEEFKEFSEPKNQFPLTIAIGAIRPNDFDSILASLVELGVDSICLFNQSGGDKKRLSEKNINRWNSIIATAVKQSKRSWNPELKTFANLECFIDSCDAQNKIVLDAASESSHIQSDIREATALVVGSEAGLSPQEMALLYKAGFQPLRIAKDVLRARTAAISALSIFSFLRESSGLSRLT